ncbi:MAG: D-alanyl-D-alanine carboxypeptidase/D-alanyl-D-alanine-endopeptidase [bacterium]
MRLFFLFTLSFLINSNYYSQTEIRDLIQSNLDRLPASTKCGILIYNSLAKDTVFSQNSSLLLIPASNTKLFTTATSLATMNGDFLFSTIIYSDDPVISDGILEGNIYLKGFGNSTFSVEELDSLVKSLFNRGLRTIIGDVIADDTYFDDYYSREDWIADETSNLKLPAVSALVLNRNEIVISLHAATTANKKLTYNISPSCSFYNVSVSAKSTKKRSTPKISVTTSENGININISGGLKRKGSSVINVDIDDPQLFASFIFYDLLKKNGIQVNGHPTKGETIIPSSELCKESVTLGDLIMPINKRSDNFAAECLFKALGAFYSGEQGNSFYATQAVLSFLRENDIYHEGTSIVDGSGISRYNNVSVKSITELLEKIYFDPYLYPYFYNSLSIAGVDGTLRNRFFNSTAYGNFRGKTGYLRGVSAVSGYLTAVTGSNYIVSIIMEFSEKDVSFYKAIQDDIITVLAEKL